MATGTRRAGDFCWINMLTPKPTEAREFYRTLLGWDYVEMPGMGHRIQVGDVDIGGIFDVNGPNTPPGARATIGVMVKVANADATCAKVTSLGGVAKAAFDIMRAGRMAVCTDPTGVEFDIWEAKNMQGTMVDSAVHGAPSWSELYTSDDARADMFYCELFGWASTSESFLGLSYTTFSLDGIDVAGMMQLSAEMGAMPPRWVTYFTVDDVDEAARLAVSLGATLCVNLHDVPGIGRFCGIVSPQGIVLYVIQRKRS